MHTPAPRHGVWVHALRVLVGLALAVLAGCGGGGDSGPPMQGSIEGRAVKAQANGNTYPISLYLPPASAGPRATLPVVYALDSEWWFTQLVTIAEATRARVIIVGIGYNANRANDYVPPNSCTPGGGGNAAYLQFIRGELVPYIESTVGGDPARRALLGHSHGGSFVYYALFAEAAGSHTFSAYLASDSSLGCMPATGEAWEAAYAAANTELPVRLHMSHTPIHNFDAGFAQRIRDRRYGRLVAHEQTYNGTHTGIIPEAFADALSYAFAP